MDPVTKAVDACYDAVMSLGSSAGSTGAAEPLGQTVFAHGDSGYAYLAEWYMKCCEIVRGRRSSAPQTVSPSAHRSIDTC